MDIFLLLQVIVLFAAIFLGVKLGGMGIGYAGGLGVVALTLGLGLNPGQIPWDVILIIMSVIGAISAMQLAGGLDYLVKIAEKNSSSQSKTHQLFSSCCYLFFNYFCWYRSYCFFYDSCNR